MNKNPWKKLFTMAVSGMVFGLAAALVFLGVTRKEMSGISAQLVELENTLSEEEARLHTLSMKAADTDIGSVPEKLTFTNEEEGEDESAGTVPETAGIVEYTSAVINETETGKVAAVAKSAMPSVVAITTVSVTEIPSYYGFWGFGFGYEDYTSTGSGSGIIVGENENELLIATNQHVINDAQTLSVCFMSDGAENTAGAASDPSQTLDIDGAIPARLKGMDEENDLAVIAVDKADIPESTLQVIRIARLGDSDTLVVGEQVVAIGNALGYGQSVTSGWVSALNRTVSLKESSGNGLIQTDAAINPGNSGGALLNLRGELIGINSAKYASTNVEGTGFAIPVSKAKPILEKLMDRKTRDRVEDAAKAAWLGANTATLSEEAVSMYDLPVGAFVREVYAGGAAQKAGIQEGDIILSADQVRVKSKKELQNLLAYYEAGETIELVVARYEDGRYDQIELMVTLQARYY